MIYGELNVVLTDLSLGSTIELGGDVLYGKLSATLADSSLDSTVGLSGDILYSVLGDASITSSGIVLVLGNGAATLDGITTTIAGLVPSNGSLLSTLEDVISRNFGAVYSGTLAPYEDVISWTGHPLTGSLVRVRTGNLVGVFGQPNEFGLFAGEGWDASSGAVPSASSKYVRLGSFTNEFHNVPVRLYDDGVITMQMEPDAPSFAMGNPIPSGYATGTGLWQGKDTDDVYKWRVGDPSIGGTMLSWSGSSLSIVNGSLDIGGASAHIALGDPPPKSPTSGTGIWIDKNGLYGLNGGVLQIFLDTLDGRLYIDGGTEFGVSPLLGNLYIEGVLTLGTDGKLLQGTGTWGVDFTGSAIWNDSGIMNIGGWNDGVKQWWGGSDGALYAGGGDVKISDNGITLESGDFWSQSNANNIRWNFGARENIFAIGTSYDNFGGVYGQMTTMDDSATVGDLLLSALSDNGLARIGLYAWTGGVNYCAIFLTKSNTTNDISLQADVTDISGNLVVEGTIKDGDDNEYGRPVFLASPLTSTTWSISSPKSSTSPTLIDMSATFTGYPATPPKALMVRLIARDSVAVHRTDLYAAFGPSVTRYYQLSVHPVGGDIQAATGGIINCDANGDIAYSLAASGTNTMDVQLEIWGYWI